MHDWSDESFDWKSLNEAEGILSDTLRFYRVPVRDIKEKYGTLRCYTGLGWTSFHSIAYPGYVYGQFPNWLWKLDVYYGYPILKYTGIAYLSYKLHCWAYRRGYAKIVKKFPHIRTEILCCADYDELLKGL